MSVCSETLNLPGRRHQAPRVSQGCGDFQASTAYSKVNMRHTRVKSGQRENRGAGVPRELPRAVERGRVQTTRAHLCGQVAVATRKVHLS